MELVDKRINHGFLFGAALQLEQHVVEYHAVVDAPEVRSALHLRARVTNQRDQFRLIHGLHDQRGIGGLRENGRADKQ